MKEFERVKVCPHCGSESEEHFSGGDGWSFCSDGCGCIEGERSVYKFRCPSCEELKNTEKFDCKSNEVMSRPLNEYPRHELEEMLRYINNCFYHETLDPIRKKWKERVNKAISDRELADKELPFKSPKTSKDELLSKFSPNMVNMVREDATSNKVFMCLLRGDSPYILIEQLLTIQIDLINDLGEANLKRPIQYIVNNASGLPFKTTEQKHGNA